MSRRNTSPPYTHLGWSRALAPATIVLRLSVAAQAVDQIAPPAHVKGEQLLLEECTAPSEAEFAEMLENFGFNPYPGEAVPIQAGDINEDVRKKIIESASQWAIAECYLPCSSKMCAYLLLDSAGHYGAYIEPVKNEEGGYAPEAIVFFNQETFQLHEAYPLHHRCRQHAEEINWVREGCKP
jgi:hypothetical protein